MPVDKLRQDGLQGLDSAPAGTAVPSALSAALIENLTAHRIAVLQARLADDPKIGVAAVVHALAGIIHRIA